MKIVASIELMGETSTSAPDLTKFLNRELMGMGIIDTDSPFDSMHIVCQEAYDSVDEGLYLMPPAILCPRCLTVFGKPSQFVAHFPCGERKPFGEDLDPPVSEVLRERLEKYIADNQHVDGGFADAIHGLEEILLCYDNSERGESE